MQNSSLRHTGTVDGGISRTRVAFMARLDKDKKSMKYCSYQINDLPKHKRNRTVFDENFSMVNRFSSVC